MKNFDALFSDPIAALGIGLLSSTNDPSQAIPMTMQFLKQGQEMKRQARKDSLLEQKLALGGDLPSAVREYEYVSKLSPEEREQFLRVKRAQQTINLGGSQAVLSPTGGIAENYPVTPKPQDMPDFKKDQAAAAAEGTALGAAKGVREKNAITALDSIGLINRAMEILPDASDGTASRIGTGIGEFFGKGGKNSQADADLEVISGRLTATSPRFEGPQGVMDVELYKKMAGNLSNANLPVETRLSAAKELLALQQKYASQGSGGAAGAGGGVDDKETYLQNLSDEELDKLLQGQP